MFHWLLQIANTDPQQFMLVTKESEKLHEKGYQGRMDFGTEAELRAALKDSVPSAELDGWFLNAPTCP